MTIVTALRGLDAKTVLKLYYNTPIPSHEDWNKQIKALARGFEYGHIIKDLETITLRYLSKCSVTNYTKMKCALTQYLFDKYIVPHQIKDWNPNPLIITEIVNNDVTDKNPPSADTYWNMKDDDH